MCFGCLDYGLVSLIQIKASCEMDTGTDEGAQCKLAVCVVFSTAAFVLSVKARLCVFDV